MRVDQHIITAIDQYLQANRLTQKEFARRLGVCEATVVKWHRAGNGVSNVHWRIIYPLIKRYLPQNRIFITNAGEEEYSSLTGEHEITSEGDNRKVFHLEEKLDVGCLELAGPGRAGTLAYSMPSNCLSIKSKTYITRPVTFGTRISIFIGTKIGGFSLRVYK